MPRGRLDSLAEMDRVLRVINREFRSAQLAPWDRADFLRMLLRDVPTAYGGQHEVSSLEASSNLVVVDWSVLPVGAEGRSGPWWDVGLGKSYTLPRTPTAGWLFRPDYLAVVWQNPVGTGAVKKLTAVLADGVNTRGIGTPLLSAQYASLARSENAALEHIYRRQAGGYRFDAVNDLEFAPLSGLWLPPQSNFRMVSTDMIAGDWLTWTMTGVWRWFAQFAEVPLE